MILSNSQSFVTKQSSQFSIDTQRILVNLKDYNSLQFYLLPLNAE